MRKKKKMLLPILAGCLALMVLVSGFLGYRLKISTDKYKALDAEIVANTQTVYVATRDIERGEALNDASTTDDPDKVNVELQNIYTDLDSSYYVQSSDLGKPARIDIPYDVPVNLAMVLDTDELSDDLREVEISVAELMTSQADNDVVDVRISFPDGSDYLLLSKKQVSNLVMGTSVWTANLREDEIITLTCATVDAYLNAGTKIYTTRYVESNVQADGVPNYPVSAVAMDLISTDPNITEKATNTLNLQARMSLEERLLGISEDQMDLITDGQENAQSEIDNALSANEETEDSATYDVLGTMDEEEN